MDWFRIIRFCFDIDPHIKKENVLSTIKYILADIYLTLIKDYSSLEGRQSKSSSWIKGPLFVPREWIPFGITKYMIRDRSGLMHMKEKNGNCLIFFRTFIILFFCKRYEQRTSSLLQSIWPKTSVLYSVKEWHTVYNDTSITTYPLHF